MNDLLKQRICIQHDINYFLPILYEMVNQEIVGKEDFTIVELGVREGSSTIAFLSALENNKKGRLWSADLDPIMDSLATELINNGLWDYWYFWQGDSVDFSEFHFSDKQVDMIFVDTSHEYDQTVKEIAAWTPKLKVGGRMIFHDTLSRYDGVSVPIQNSLKNKKTKWSYYNIDVITGLGIMIKKS